MGRISVEPLVALLRYHGGVGDYGDSFAFSCTCCFHGEEAHISCAQGTFTPEIYRAIDESLRGMGITRAVWERIGDGKVRRVTVGQPKEQAMANDLTMYCEIKKQDGRLFYKGANTFAGIDANGLAVFQRGLNDIAGLVKTGAGAPGKAYNVSLDFIAVDSDAGGVVVASNPILIQAVPYHHILKIEEKLMHYGLQLGSMGRQSQQNKHKNDHKR